MAAQPQELTRRVQTDAADPRSAGAAWQESSLTCAMAATFLDEIYRSLDETYASLGLARWNQPHAEAIWQARNLPEDTADRTAA
ncbi:hypothetical protein [Saccharopolyspora oryzae]|uniref:Uncharacterized protein n=1 Tax=Saccharopolyspora oryzae TaxID=2997343 RepID=A0ABT4V9F2_9PSEU|nr:hypothetical protein [Saccharopolyspora oryzae]MDA3630563.1 hypothetical protein [Saccharopolyspora oryzae]